MSNASLPSQIAMYACSCKRAGRQKTVSDPLIFQGNLGLSVLVIVVVGL